MDCISLIPSTQCTSTESSNCRPSEGSSYCSLADFGSLDWGAPEAEFCVSGYELPLHFSWTCPSLFYDSTSVVTAINQYGYDALFLFIAIDRQDFSQGRSCAMTPLIHYLSQGSVFLGTTWIAVQGQQRCSLHVTSSELVRFMVAFGDGQQKFQQGRRPSVFYQHNELRLLWDPGGKVAAWGQAAFQGGRGVRDPSCMPPWAGTWAIIMGWA